jgi:hypothetical protein
MKSGLDYQPVDLDDATPALFRLSAADGVTAYYGSPGADIVSSTTAFAINTLAFTPFWSGPGGVVSEIAFNVTISGGAGAKARCGLYDGDQVNLLPTSLIVDGGEFDGTLVQLDNTILSPQVVLKRGRMYWLAYLCGTGAPTVTSYTSGWHMAGRGSSFNANFGWVKTGFTYGVLPGVAPAPTGLLSNAPPLVALRFAVSSRPLRTP